jgi:hypothetical protein
MREPEPGRTTMTCRWICLPNCLIWTEKIAVLSKYRNSLVRTFDLPLMVVFQQFYVPVHFVDFSLEIDEVHLQVNDFLGFLTWGIRRRLFRRGSAAGEWEDMTEDLCGLLVYTIHQSVHLDGGKVGDGCLHYSTAWIIHSGYSHV